MSKLFTEHLTVCSANCVKFEHSTTNCETVHGLPTSEHLLHYRIKSLWYLPYFIQSKQNLKLYKAVHLPWPVLYKTLSMFYPPTAFNVNFCMIVYSMVDHHVNQCNHWQNIIIIFSLSTPILNTWKNTSELLHDATTVSLICVNME